MNPELDISTQDAANLLPGIVNVNMKQIRRRFGGTTPSRFPILRGIQTGRVRYKRHDPTEKWQTWDNLMEQLDSRGIAEGDCEDLSSAVAAELLDAGLRARTYVYKSGPKLYHVVVKTDRWGLLDPSRAAGMEGNG